MCGVLLFQILARLLRQLQPGEQLVVLALESVMLSPSIFDFGDLVGQITVPVSQVVDVGSGPVAEVSE